MKTRHLLLATAILIVQTISIHAQEIPRLGKSLLNEIIKAITIEEKVDLLTGVSSKTDANLNATVGS